MPIRKNKENRFLKIKTIKQNFIHLDFITENIKFYKFVVVAAMKY